MPIPDFQTLMLPLIQLASDGKVHQFRNAVEAISERFKLTEAERTELMPSGPPIFYNRLAWAKSHLKKAGLLEFPQRGTFQITPRGTEILAKAPPHINVALLRELYVKSIHTEEVGAAQDVEQVGISSGVTPQEAIEQAHHLLRRELADELLASIKGCTPAFFEHLVVQLMITMGYGGSREEAGRTVGRSGDGGIDGIINEDRLGLDSIYLQAKRWEGVVGRPEIMKFVGALAGQRATKGVFITTSWFTQEAKDYAASSQYKVVLIDGERLAYLMIEHDLGVSVAATYHLKRIDSDFFSEE